MGSGGKTTPQERVQRLGRVFEALCAWYDNPGRTQIVNAEEAHDFAGIMFKARYGFQDAAQVKDALDALARRAERAEEALAKVRQLADELKQKTWQRHDVQSEYETYGMNLAGKKLQAILNGSDHD